MDGLADSAAWRDLPSARARRAGGDRSRLPRVTSVTSVLPEPQPAWPAPGCVLHARTTPRARGSARSARRRPADDWNTRRLAATSRLASARQRRTNVQAHLGSRRCEPSTRGGRPGWAGGGRGCQGWKATETAGNDQNGCAGSGLRLQLGRASRRSTVLYAANRPRIGGSRELQAANRWRIWMRGRVDGCKSTTHRVIARVAGRKSTARRAIRGGSGARSAAHRARRRPGTCPARPHLAGREAQARGSLERPARRNQGSRRGRARTNLEKTLAGFSSRPRTAQHDLLQDGK
jgi:hypothetical protein